MILATSNQTRTIYELGGYMTNVNGAVTATLHFIPYFTSSCFQNGEEITFTGTVTSGDEIVLTSGVVSGQTISVSGTAANGSLLSGTFRIAGGCAGGDNGNVAGLVDASYSGAYSGTFQTGAPAPVGVTATLTQSGPNADGEFGVSGTLKFSGSPCFTTGTIDSSTVYGDYIQVGITTDQGGSLQFTGSAIATPTSISLNGVYQVTAGACAGQVGSGALNS